MNVRTTFFLATILVLLNLYAPLWAIEIYYVDAIDGDDFNNGSSLETAFATIQKGIESSKDSDIVLIYPGIYQEEINFLGKAITVQGVATSAGIPILENPSDFAASFYHHEGPDSILKNIVIRNSIIAVFLSGSSPTISNVTIVDNQSGISATFGAEPDIRNSIFWNNSGGDLIQCQASYSWIEDNIKCVPMESLVAHWQFDEGIGTTAYDSAGDKHGNIHGGQWVDGQINGALSFDGSDDYVELPDNDPIWLPMNDFSLSIWVCSDNEFTGMTNLNEIILDLNYAASSNPNNELGYNIQMRGNKRLCFQMTTRINSDEDLYSNESLKPKRWYHIVALRDGRFQAIYINGRLDAIRACSTSLIVFWGGYDDNKV